MNKELCCFGEYVPGNERCKTCEDNSWCEIETKYKKEQEDGKTR